MSRSKGKGKGKAKGRVNVGRTFADKDNPRHWYVYLPVDGIYLLVRWERGVLRLVQRNTVRLDAFDFPMFQLLKAWGITAETLDNFLEVHTYAADPDVLHVRATKRPLNGRTIEHVRHQHPVPHVGGP